MGRKKGGMVHHTQKERERMAAALKNRGGGKAGEDSRRPKCSLVCKICGAPAPALSSLKVHWEAKHPKLHFNAADYGEGGSTSGVSTKGTGGGMKTENKHTEEEVEEDEEEEEDDEEEGEGDEKKDEASSSS